VPRFKRTGVVNAEIGNRTPNQYRLKLLGLSKNKCGMVVNAMRVIRALTGIGCGFLVMRGRRMRMVVAVMMMAVRVGMRRNFTRLIRRMTERVVGKSHMQRHKYTHRYAKNHHENAVDGYSHSQQYKSSLGGIATCGNPHA
jgi:hypothetical protein